MGIIILSFTFFVLGLWGLVKTNRKNKLARESKTTESTANQVNAGQTKKQTGGCWFVLAIFLIIITLVVTISHFGDKDKETGNKTEPTNEPTKTPAETDKNWDGNYNAQMVKPNCDSSVEFTSFQVVDNAVVNLWGKNVPIGSDGRATIVIDTGTVMTTELTFSDNGVSGSWKTTRGCSGTLSATKSHSWF